MSKRRGPGSSKRTGRLSASHSLGAGSAPDVAPANGSVRSAAAGPVADDPARPATSGGPRAGEAKPPPADGGYSSAEYRALQMAVEEGRVSFHQVATAWFHSHFGGERCSECQGVGTVLDPPAGSMSCAVCTKACETCGGTGTLRDRQADEAYANIFPELLRVFGEQRGGVITAYFCENIRVGAALTDIWSAADRADGPILSLEEIEREKADRARPRGFMERTRDWLGGRFRQRAASTAIHLEPTFGDPDSPRAKQILFRCLKVHYQALEFLDPKPRKICMRMTFNVITMLLGTLDSRIGRGEPASAFDTSHADQRALEEELARTESYYLQSAMRTARLEYLAGMLPGLVLAGVAAYLVHRLEWAPPEMAIAFLAGGLGALVSVMGRLTSGKLALNHESGKPTLRLLGAIRPLIGALLGLALFVFISGDVLLSIEPPGDADTEPYFFAAIGFLAGFSERWAQDMIDPSKLSQSTPQAPGPAPPATR